MKKDTIRYKGYDEKKIYMGGTSWPCWVKKEIIPKKKITKKIPTLKQQQKSYLSYNESRRDCTLCDD